MDRRALILLGAATIGGMGQGGITSCSTKLDPATIAAAIQAACGIAIPAATVLEVINAAAGATAGVIVSLVCSSYKNSVASQASPAAQPASGKPAAGGNVTFTVHVCDATGASCKDIPVTGKTV